MILKFYNSLPKNSKLGVLALCSVCFIFKVPKILNLMRKYFYKLKSNEIITYVVSSNTEATIALETLKRKLKEQQLLGLDCEWVTINGRKQPVALLQLAAPDGYCSLFRLSSLKTVPVDLVNLLEDKSVLKVGVAVVIDSRYLLADYGVRCEGCLDLRHLAAHVGVEPRGLANLANDLFGTELDKNWRVRCSNWETDVLSPTQIEYAAKDALIAINIFNELNHREICKQFSIWERLFWTKSDYWRQSVHLWSPFIGLNFKERSRGGGGSSQTASSKRPKVDVIPKRNQHTFIQKEHYSNIFLLAPDDQVLCTISESKASWYIEKELVDILDSKTLRLRFEPAKRSSDPDNYYARPKENCCVVCGSKRDLRRKNIVPLEYRKNFDEKLKNHNSHDILLLCFPCHHRSNMHDRELRGRLVIECEAPLPEGKNSKMLELPDVKAVRSAARALFFNGATIPAKRKEYLESVIRDKFNITDLTQDFLEEIINIECLMEREHYVPHGMKVVQHYLERGGVEELERRWRQYFLDTMCPKHLPDLWSVNYIRE